MKLTEKLTKLRFKTNYGKADAKLPPLCVLLGLIALWAALPAGADDFSARHAATAGSVTSMTASSSSVDLASSAGGQTQTTVMPNGAIRHTVRRVYTSQPAVQLLAAQIALANHMLTTPMGAPMLGMGAGQAGVPGHPLSVDLRLGASVSPRIKFVGGIDARIPGLSMGPGFTTRADLDAVVSANFGGVSTLFPLTIDELYHADLPGGHGLYAGLGIGPMFGEVTRFGGKIIVGANLTPRLRLEGNVLFAGYGDALFNIQLRIPVL